MLLLGRMFYKFNIVYLNNYFHAESNKVVCRSFPVAALHSVKRIGNTRVITTIPAAPTIATSFDMGGASSLGEKHSKLRGGRGISSSSSSEILDVYRLRALTMQMMRLGFDPDEVSSEARDDLKRLLIDLRFHAVIGLSFNALHASRTPEGLITTDEPST